MQINERRLISIGGFPQRIHLWSEQKEAPVILFLHGGPGDPIRHKVKKSLLPLAKDYALAVIDERGAGGSFNAALKAEDLSLENYLSDIKEWTEYLKKRFHQGKIYLIGHSFGSLLAVHAIKNDPSSYAAYLGVGQFVDGPKSLSVQYDLLLSKIAALGDALVEKRLQEIGKPTNGSFKNDADLEYFLSKLYPILEPAGYPSFQKREIIPFLRSTEYSLKEKREFKKARALSEEAKGSVLHLQIQSLDPLGYSFKVPFYIAQGTEDFITPYSLAKEYAEKIRAPKKGFLSYSSSMHQPLFEEPERFIIDVRNRFRESTD